MAISNFITSVWSETLLNSLEKEYVAVKNCNREFEGEIQNAGDSVKVCAVSAVKLEQINDCKSCDNCSLVEVVARARASF